MKNKMKVMDDLYWVGDSNHINYKILWPLIMLACSLIVLLHNMPG